MSQHALGVAGIVAGLLLSLALTQPGCGGDSFTEPEAPGQDASVDSPAGEVGPDTSVGDVAQEADQDTADGGMEDVAPDADGDVQGDAPEEVADGGPDASDDVVEQDVPEDSAEEVLQDVAADSPDASCTEGDLQCYEDVVQRCGSDGLWHVDTYCPALQHAAGSTCSGGACVVACDTGWVDCNGTASDGCEIASGVETACDGLDEDCSGVADDHLPADPYTKDEGSADACEQAYTDSFTPLIENGGKKTYQFYLYKADGSPDRDFYSFPTAEQSNPECVANPSWYECYTITVRIAQEPAGKDYELCLYDMDGSGPGASCTGKPKACSKQDGNGPNEVVYSYQGGCGTNDNNRFVVEVSGVTDSDHSCESYTLEMELTGTGPKPTDCGL